MSLAPGTLSSGSRWSLRSCTTRSRFPLSNLSEVAAQPWAQPWLAYSETPWTEWMAGIGFCALPHEGRFTEPLVRTRTCACRADWCRSEHDWFAPAKGISDTMGAWTTAVSWLPGASWQEHGYGWFSSSEVLSCLAGQLLVFEGDSLTRQAFLRLVWWLRGSTHMVEHYFSQHAAYTFNATDDSFVIFGEQPMRTYSRPTDAKAEAELVAHLRRVHSPTSVSIAFRWAPRPRVSLGDTAQASFQRMGRVAGIVQGFAGRFTLRWPAAHDPRGEWPRMPKVKSWWSHSPPHRPPLGGSDQACSPHLGGAAKLLTRSLSEATPPPPGRAKVAYAYPARPTRRWRRQRFDLDAMNAAAGAPHFFRRARLCVRDQSLELSNASRLDFGGGSCTIDGDTLLASGGQRQHGHRIPLNQRFHHMSDEDIHFECSFANQWPAAIVGWKMPENGDCRGLVSLNLAQAVLNRIARQH